MHYKYHYSGVYLHFTDVMITKYKCDYLQNHMKLFECLWLTEQINTYVQIAKEFSPEWYEIE